MGSLGWPNAGKALTASNATTNIVPNHITNSLRFIALSGLCICWGPTSKTGENISAKGRIPT